MLSSFSKVPEKDHNPGFSPPSFLAVGTQPQRTRDARSADPPGPMGARSCWDDGRRRARSDVEARACRKPSPRSGPHVDRQQGLQRAGPSSVASKANCASRICCSATLQVEGDVIAQEVTVRSHVGHHQAVGSARGWLTVEAISSIGRCRSRKARCSKARPGGWRSTNAPAGMQEMIAPNARRKVCPRPRTWTAILWPSHPRPRSLS